MRLTQKLPLLLCLLFAQQYVYADGGSNRPYYVYKSVSCPSGQSGTINYQCTYTANYGIELCADRYFPSGGKWVALSSSCVLLAPTYVSTKSETKKVLCPSSAPVGVITQSRRYELWSNGTNKNYTSWVTTTNTCKAIPEQILQTKDGSEEVSCDSYYSVTKGSYSGSVYKYGEYVSFYDASTMTTKKTFNIKSIDVTSCVSEISGLSTEYTNENCSTGQSGSIRYYRYKAVNSKSETIYPYGDWSVLENTCAGEGVHDDSPTTPTNDPIGLLENIYFTSSDIIKNDALPSYLKTLAAKSWSAQEKHKLTINIDDLSNGKYNAAKVSNAIEQFQSIVGLGNADVKLVLPRSMDKLVGSGGITAAAASSKSIILKNIQLAGKDAVVTYLDLTSGSSLSMPVEKQMKISVLTGNIDLQGVYAE